MSSNKTWLPKRRTSLFLTCAGIWMSMLWTAAAGFKTVVIDAGHGGADLGAADSLVYEKHINLDVARRLEIALQKQGFATVMTRTGDYFVPLDERAAIANRRRNCVFVSIHFNSSWKNKVNGVETFYRSGSGKKLAEIVQFHLLRNLGAQNRGVKTANFVVLRKTNPPAILVEGGFVSNKTEREAMQDPRFRQLVADSIAQALVKAQRMRL